MECAHHAASAADWRLAAKERHRSVAAHAIVKLARNRGRADDLPHTKRLIERGNGRELVLGGRS